MTNKILAATALASIALAGFAGAAEARDQIRIVGSSTVFPFATVVAEQFGKTTEFKTPVIESTGSGGGIKLFCAGTGIEHPDITNASRAIKESELEMCAENGVDQISEVKIGFDGIVIANAKSGPEVDFTKRDLWLALAKRIPVDGKLVENPYRNWSDVNPDLPNVAIEVLGPPPTSGTRDAFAELVMEAGCEEVAGAKEAGLEGKACMEIREDGAYIEAGENDNLIVQKLDANPNAFGIFGYSFLDQNQDKIKGATIGGVEPSFDNIASGEYGVSRPLFFYVKNAHVGTIPGLKEYVAEFVSDKASGEFGYLTDKGLIPLPQEQFEEMQEQAMSLTPMTM